MGQQSIRRTVRSTAALILVVGTLLATGGTATPVTPGAADHVVLIGLDGFDPSYLGRAPTPNLDRLATEGVHGVTRGVMLPITTPSFTAIASGTWPSTNGTLTYYFDRATGTFRTGSPPSRVPTVASAVTDAGGTVGAAQYFAFRGNGAAYGDPEALYTQPGGACSNMFDDAIAMLRQEPVDSNGTSVTVPRVPTLLGVYCPQLDTIGHAEGAESPAIADALADADAQIGRLLDTLDELGIADTTTVIVTGDHGMSSYTQRNTLPLNTALRDAGYRTQMLLLDGQTLDPDANVLIVPAAGRATSIYLVGDLADDADALADVARVGLATEGIARVFDRADQAEMHMNPNFGDLILEAAPGWSTGVLPVPNPMGDHGSSDELDAAFFMAGAGVAQRSEPVRVCHVNIGPTIASLLGLAPLADADGGALDGDWDDIPGCPTAGPADDTTTTSTTTTTSVPAESSTTLPTVPSTTVDTGSDARTSSLPPATRSGPPTIGPAPVARAVAHQPRYTG